MNIYMITNIITGKNYIGFTSKMLSERFHKHYTNATSGINSYLYKSIRKYGIENFSIKLMDTASTQIEAYEKEKQYIEKYNTLAPNGYNIGAGGTGGWIIGNLSREDQEAYYQKRSFLTTFDKNPNFSGFSDEDLLEIGTKYFTQLGYIGGQRVWQRFAKHHNYPQTFSKNRFEGKYSVFANIIRERTNLEIKKNYKTDNHKTKIRIIQKNKMWVTNGLFTKRIGKHEYETYKQNGYIQGRKKC